MKMYNSPDYPHGASSPYNSPAAFIANEWLSERNGTEESLRTFLKKYRDLEVISMAHVDISHVMAHEIGDLVLPTLKSLQRLELSSLPMLLGMLGKGQGGIIKNRHITVETLDLCGIQMNEGDCALMQTYLSENRCLHTINFKNCEIAIIDVIEEQLSINKSLARWCNGCHRFKN